MNQTVVGVFNSYQAAERAVAELEGQGFERSTIQIKATQSDSVSGSSGVAGGSTASDRDEGTGVMASIRHFFRELFNDDEDSAGNYSEAVRRGGAVVTVETDESRLELARQALQGAGALDIDEQVSSWRSRGWAGHDTEAAPYSREQATSEGENVVPVVQEELEVGKRTVSGGAVRVVSRVVTRPVSEQVELRTEQASIERRAVDRPATEADLAAFQERTIEVREMSERPVVSKTAHVVEEVVVGKQVSTETQTVEDTVRRTEVEVERVGEQSGARGMSGASSTGSAGTTTGGADTSGSGTTSGTASTSNGAGAPGGGLAGAMSGGAATSGGSVSGASTSGGRRSFTELEDEFRSDYQTNFAHTGASYEELQPAYRGGYELRGDSRFADSSWDDVEPDLRQRWESEHPGSAWERVKSAVRRGWDRATS
jgi:uncharacterized protein (TIGR02271 family)